SKSKTKVAQITRETKDKLRARAVALYQHELQKDLQAGEKRMSLRTVCYHIEDEHRRQGGKDIRLNRQTLLRHVQGGKTLSMSNAEKSWLLPEEADIVIRFATEVANRGFPLSHKRLKEAVDEICRARLGASFPPGGVGKNW
ncbi:hypothetical protein B0H14DRAFT_2229233, partial [Mycena olivaceomarginata]